MPPKPLEPGDPLTLGRFELFGRLGEGGQGVVYLGRGTGPGEDRVAVKILRSSVDAMVLERLARELDAVHQVQPFVTAGVIEASAEGDRRYIVSEFIDGPSLQDRVDTSGPLPVGDLERLAVGTATALTAIHGAGVIHRDFKPANVLLGPDGPRVVDFGIARLTDASTITSGLIGTPSYVAPEQLAGARPTAAVDIFAWAVTMIFAATGRPAFDADSVSAVMHRILYEEPDVTGVPPSLQPIVRQCLAKDPTQRPAARDLLLRLLDPSPNRTDLVPPSTRAGPPTVNAVPPTGTISPMSRPQPTGPVAPPGYQPTGPVAPPTHPMGPSLTRPRRGPILAICGAVILAALIIGGVLLLTRGPGPSTAIINHPTTSSIPGPASPAPTSSPGRTPSSSSPAAPSSGPVLMAAFAGHWSGTAAMSPVGDPTVSLPNGIEFTFVTGARTIHETNGNCVNTLTLNRETSSVLTFSEPATTECVAGTVTFTRHGSDLAYRWTDNIEQNTATLRKS